MSTSYNAEDVLLYMAMRVSRAWFDTQQNIEELCWEESDQYNPHPDSRGAADLPEHWQTPFREMEALVEEVKRRAREADVFTVDTLFATGIPCLKPPRTYSDGSPVLVYVGTDYFEVGDTLHTDAGDYDQLGHRRKPVLVFPGETDNAELAKIRQHNNWWHKNTPKQGGAV